MKFKVKPDTNAAQRSVWSINLGNSEEVCRLQSRAKQLAKVHDMTLAQLVVQMIEHCLNDTANEQDSP